MSHRRCPLFPPSPAATSYSLPHVAAAHQELATWQVGTGEPLAFVLLPCSLLCLRHLLPMYVYACVPAAGNHPTDSSSNHAAKLLIMQQFTEMSNACGDCRRLVHETEPAALGIGLGSNTCCARNEPTYLPAYHLAAAPAPVYRSSLLENVLDSSHVPFTHHNSISNRNTVGAYDIKLTSHPTVAGFAGE